MNLDQLKKDIVEFEAYMEHIKNEQVSFPLDNLSSAVVQKDLLIPTGNIIVPYSLATYDNFCEVYVKGKKYLLNTSSPS